jgi:hypothetical protein
MPEKNTPNKKQATNKPPVEKADPASEVTLPTLVFDSGKVNFGTIRHGPHLKKTILKMSDTELSAYAKQIGMPFNGNKMDFLWAAISQYNSQQ